jgi:hypothetical protein
MTMSEYEERFQCFWVAAALVGAITMTCKAALDHTVHNETDNGWQIRKSGIR